MKNKILSFFILFIIISTSTSYGFTSLPLWNTLETTETSSDSLENYLSLESESAILIEQSTRKSSF